MCQSMLSTLKAQRPDGGSRAGTIRTATRIFAKSTTETEKLILDEEFVPFEGAPARQEELVIDASSRLASTGRIVLKSGRVLLRRSTYQGEREIVNNWLRR